MGTVFHQKKFRNMKNCQIFLKKFKKNQKREVNGVSGPDLDPQNWPQNLQSGPVPHLIFEGFSELEKFFGAIICDSNIY